MKEIARLLKLRKEARKRSPLFVVKASKFSKRVPSRWRYPNGRHSPIRQEHRGKPALVRIGYGLPKAVRGLHESGLQFVTVHTASELLKLNKQEQGAVISGKVGNRKRLALLELAIQKGIRVLNLKDAQCLQKLKEDFAERKKNKTEKAKQKGKKQQEKEKQAIEKKKKEEEEKKQEEKKDLEEVASSEEQKQKETVEIEKTLIKKQ